MESPIAPQPTEPQGQPTSTQAPLQARLAVITSRAKVFRSGGVQNEVQQAQSVDIQLYDRIEVVQLEGQGEQGYNILNLADFLNVELFSNASLVLANVRQEAGGSTAVTLDLDNGHIFVHLNEQTTTQVTVETPYTTITTLTGGAEFDVCHNEALTCIVVKRGVVEIIAEDKRQIVKAGESGYVLRKQPPSPVICAPTPFITTWEESYRRFADTPALQEQIAGLPQKPCPVTAAGIPLNARMLYRDEFRNSYSGWDQGTIDNFMVRYFGRRYYDVQAQGPEDQYLAFVPNGRKYEDVNIDLRALAEAGNVGDFRYGLVFRRSGNQYYAFVVSPRTETWYFLKSSLDALETLKQGKDERMRGLEGRDTLRVEAYGSTFLVFINLRLIDWISDSDYASGEVGLFVETIDSPDALIRFDSLVVWDMPPVSLIPNTGGREYCFNASDDDGDGWIDRADPDCQRPDLVLTSLPLPTSTLRPTSTARPTDTPLPPPTNTVPPPPTNTNPPAPTNTDLPPPTNTDPPPPTNTDPPPATNTDPPPPIP